jgi:hypothetical protein
LGKFLLAREGGLRSCSRNLGCQASVASIY